MHSVTCGFGYIAYIGQTRSQIRSDQIPISLYTSYINIFGTLGKVCVHGLCVVLVLMTAGMLHRSDRSDQIRSEKIRSDQKRSDRTRPDQISFSLCICLAHSAAV